MANYFACQCDFCGTNVIVVDEREGLTDKDKMARMHCYKCESRNVRLEPMNDAYYAKYPDSPRPREGGVSYPFEPDLGSMN